MLRPIRTGTPTLPRPQLRVTPQTPRVQTTKPGALPRPQKSPSSAVVQQRPVSTPQQQWQAKPRQSPQQVMEHKPSSVPQQLGAPHWPIPEDAKTEFEARAQTVFIILSGGVLEDVPKEDYRNILISNLHALGYLDNFEPENFSSLEVLERTLNLDTIAKYLKPHQILELGILGTVNSQEGLSFLDKAFEILEYGDDYQAALNLGWDGAEQRVSLRVEKIGDMLSKIPEERLNIIKGKISSAYHQIRESFAAQIEELTKVDERGDKIGNDGQINRLINLGAWFDELSHQLRDGQPAPEPEAKNDTEDFYFPEAELGFVPLSVPAAILDNIADRVSMILTSENQVTSPENTINDMVDDASVQGFVRSNLYNEQFSKENLIDITEEGDNLLFHFKDGILKFSNRTPTNLEYRGSNLKEYATKNSWTNLAELTKGNIDLFRIATNQSIANLLYSLAQDVGAVSPQGIRDVIQHFSSNYNNANLNIDRIEQITEIVLNLHERLRAS
ncbi:hypothetical protein TRICHSKD4_3006 [Roseibium sp. TrichSKD4]|uniref:hypothetical protein n=1 Tax=Roseibium sp. TrichSKD4 TaxID=744980 RepID=UPI0001E56A7B|nr:hypothetical protein [Roseibium sp. TrichSKD4]EFO31911.1 hypothetical protein TRICHSKD4_3006 [Roseibium sp. TrichSKD4]